MQRAWLLTFSSTSSDVTLDHLRMVGGFRLDECYATVGVRHKFVLMNMRIGSKGLVELRCIERFVLRMQKEYGVSPSAMPDSCAIVSDVGRHGNDLWLHPGFRVMVDRAKHLDQRLLAWRNGSGDLLHKHGNVCCCKKDVLDTAIREAILVNRSANYRLKGSMLVQRFNRPRCECSAALKREEETNIVGRRRRRGGEEGEEAAKPYRYVKRENDDKWEVGWV